MTTENPRLVQYLHSIEEQFSPERLEGYLPANAIIDAYSKGEEDGQEKFFNEIKNLIVNNVGQHFIYSVQILKFLTDRKYKIDSCWISPFSKKTIYVTSVENTIDDDFIDFFYEKAFDFESRFLNDNQSTINFSFISNEYLDEEELECDNFIKLK